MSDPQRRSSPRFSAGVHARLETADSRHDCRVDNLSRSGALLTGELPELASDRLEVTLQDPSGHLELRLAARVVRVAAGESGERSIGVQFDSPDDDQKRRLEILINRLLEARTFVPLDDLPPNASPHEIRAALSRVPLAHRVTLATRADKRGRELLLHDTAPQVLEALARNPNLMVAEARELAAVRHLLASTLELMARDPRWRDDEEIRTAIAIHHRVPVPLADRLLPKLSPLALRKALASPSLHDSMRRKILYVLAHRR